MNWDWSIFVTSLAAYVAGYLIVNTVLAPVRNLFLGSASKGMSAEIEKGFKAAILDAMLADQKK